VGRLELALGLLPARGEAFVLELGHDFTPGRYGRREERGSSAAGARGTRAVVGDGWRAAGAPGGRRAAPAGTAGGSGTLPGHHVAQLVGIGAVPEGIVDV